MSVYPLQTGLARSKKESKDPQDKRFRIVKKLNLFPPYDQRTYYLALNVIALLGAQPTNTACQIRSNLVLSNTELVDQGNCRTGLPKTPYVEVANPREPLSDFEPLALFRVISAYKEEADWSVGLQSTRLFEINNKTNHLEFFVRPLDTDERKTAPGGKEWVVHYSIYRI